MIYHISGNTFESDENQFFEKVNPANWAITNIGFANEPFDETIGLAYAGSGSFIMADWDELFSLNGSTGAISSIGSAPDIMKGLAYADFTLSLTNLSLGSLCRRSGKSNLQVRYVIDNLSLTNANDAVLSFTSNSTFVSDSLGACSVSGSVVTCNIGDVPSGASVVLDVFSTVSFKRSTPVSNNARISSDEWETPGDVQNNYHNFNDKCSGGPIN